jgi:hypothetical protein
MAFILGHSILQFFLISSNLSFQLVLKLVVLQVCLCMIDDSCLMVTSAVNFSEKSLVERAFELRAELENAASDVSSLFAKIGLYNFLGS